jgi:hypothetical protein
MKIVERYSSSETMYDKFVTHKTQTKKFLFRKQQVNKIIKSKKENSHCTMKTLFLQSLEAA